MDKLNIYFQGRQNTLTCELAQTGRRTNLITVDHELTNITQHPGANTMPKYSYFLQNKVCYCYHYVHICPCFSIKQCRNSFRVKLKVAIRACTNNISRKVETFEPCSFKVSLHFTASTYGRVLWTLAYHLTFVTIIVISKNVWRKMQKKSRLP